MLGASVPAAFEAMPDVAKMLALRRKRPRALGFVLGAGALVWLYASYMCGRQAAFASPPQSRKYEKAAVISSRERARKVAAVVAKFTAVVSLHAYCQRHWAIGAAA